MGGSDGGGNLLDLQDTMLSTSAEEEENSTMTDHADQEVNPAHTEKEQCKSTTVTWMDIDDTIQQIEDATWAALPTSDEQKRMAVEDVMVDVEEPILHREATTGPPDPMIQDAQPSGSENDDSPDGAESLLSSEETAATNHVASSETVTSGVQDSTPAGEELGPNRSDIERTPDHRKVHEGFRLANEKQWTETRPLEQSMAADTVKVKLENHIAEAVLESGEEPAVAAITGHSHETEMNTLGNIVPKNYRERGEIALEQPETPPSTQSSTKNVRFKEETPKPSRKPKLEAETPVKAEHSADVPWQDIAPKFEENDQKPLPVKTRSMGPARTPREAVRREIDRQLTLRRAKQEKKRQRKQTQKRKCEPSTEERGAKVSRMLEVDNAAVAARLVSSPGRDLSRVHGFVSRYKDHETAEEETEQASPDDDDEPGKADPRHDIDEPEESNVLDFDLKRAVTNANISSPKKMQKVFGHGRASIGSTGGLTIENMRSPLWKEQAHAVYWMVNQEEIPIGPRGGILAAGMGTGKTVMSLGIIAGNPPLEEDLRTYSRATLVIVPNNTLATQWRDKIAEHCEEALVRESMVFDPKKGRSPAFIQMRKIVVTTYYEICKQKPTAAALQALKQNWDNPKWRKVLPSSARTSPLYYVNWYRVILDEAQKITNKETKNFKSCRALKAKYRWCLSGTPLSNTDEEVFPYLNFLACDFAKSFTTFSMKFKAEQELVRKGKEGSRPNLDALMDLVQYRYLLGDVVTLGEAKDISVPLSVEEALIYGNVKPIMSKRAGKSQRFRQMVSHIFNLDRMFCDDFCAAELDQLIKELKALQERRSVFDVLEQHSADPASIQMYSSGLRKVREILEQRQEDTFQFEPLLSKIKEEQELQMKTCTRCMKKPRSWNWVRAYHCCHLFCSDCLPPPPRPAPEEEECAHPDCHTKLAFGNLVPTFARLTTAALNSNGPSPMTDVNGCQVVKLNDKRPALLSNAFSLIPMPPSTKLTMAASIILTWRKDHPDDKIVVFFGCLPSVQILGSLLKMAGERFLYIFGSTGGIKAQLALSEFKKIGGTPILLAGLQSAGEGINLTEGNRVIVVDLWWNNAKEDQAFARVHRIGQTKPTHFVRIVSDGDKRITAIQDRKTKEVSYAMKEDGHKVKKLDKNAYNALFDVDPNSTDDDGSEDEDEYQDEDDENDAVKVARSVEHEAHNLAEHDSIPPADSTGGHGVEGQGAIHCGVMGDDTEAQGVVQSANGDEMSKPVDNGYGDQSQVLLLSGP